MYQYYRSDRCDKYKKEGNQLFHKTQELRYAKNVELKNARKLLDGDICRAFFSGTAPTHVVD